MTTFKFENDDYLIEYRGQENDQFTGMVPRLVSVYRKTVDGSLEHLAKVRSITIDVDTDLGASLVVETRV